MAGWPVATGLDPGAHVFRPRNTKPGAGASYPAVPITKLASSLGLLRQRLPQPQVLRHATRMTVAAILAFAAARAFALPEGYWAVISAVVVMQGSLGGTLGASLDRLMATVAGAMVGAALRIPSRALAGGSRSDPGRRPNRAACAPCGRASGWRRSPQSSCLSVRHPEPGC